MTDYQLIPQPTDQRNQSQVDILADFTYLQTSVGHDHNFTNTAATANDGLHKQSTYFVGPTPTTTASQVAVYAANDANAVPQLFVRPSNNGTAFQLTSITSGTVPAFTNGTATTNSGVSYLPGGLLIQWATQTANNLAAITFPVSFNASLPAHPVVICNPTGINVFDFVHAQSITQTGFTLSYLSNTGAGLNGRNFSYIAIGPA